jgi:hypothetical protein
MKRVGKYHLFELEEFGGWLSEFNQTRTIKHIQHHHTWVPDHDDFDGNNHFKMCDSL